MTPKCRAPRTSCGTPSGWRAGGRCVRCRLAHNNETSRRRGLTDQERYSFLTLLRSGKTVEEAAEWAGVGTATLVQAARRDGELRAALDGMPVNVQAAAKRAEFLAALVRCGGNQTLAEAQAGLPPGTASYWRRAEPAFDAVVVAVREWLGVVVTRPSKPHVRLTARKAERLKELWTNNATYAQIGKELGVSSTTITNWRKKLGLEPRRQS